MNGWMYITAFAIVGLLFRETVLLKRQLAMTERAQQGTQDLMRRLLDRLLKMPALDLMEFASLSGDSLRRRAEEVVEQLESLMKTKKQAEAARLLRSTLATTWDETHGILRDWHRTSHLERLAFFQNSLWATAVNEVIQNPSTPLVGE